MTAPNMAAITASLERSLQSFSLNHHNHHSHNSNSSSSGSSGGNGGEGSGGNFSRSSAADIGGGCQLQSTTSSDATLELNSNITLPYHWEQCLDLKTGEVYYINWRTGMKSKEDPRSSGVDDGYFYSDDEDEEDEDDDDDDDEYESTDQGSSVESSSRKEEEEEEEEKQEDGSSSSRGRIGGSDEKHVLVVAGCKGCFMYLMVPKQVEDCPKCCGQLLHFDRSDDNAA